MKKYLLILCLFVGNFYSFAQSPKPKVLVFSKTKGWRHTSIPFAHKAIIKLGEENGFVVDYTEESARFNDINLKKYAAIVFNCTTGDVLSNAEQAAFERYIQAGGGYVGIHSAADTEYGWPWYGELTGAYFESHPSNSNVQEATIWIDDNHHPATTHLGKTWVKTDEWYNYKNIYPNLNILMSLDESTYMGGTNGGNHPIAWYHEYDGGRSFFTGLGHTDESFDDPVMLKHLLGGIKYAMGNYKPLNYNKAYAETKPEENRFEKTVLVNDLDNPMELAVSSSGKVYFTELKGNLTVYNTNDNTFKLIHRFPLTLKGGTGLIGVTLDPDFDHNHWIYVYYSPPIEGEPIYFHLSRFKLSPDDEIDLSSEETFIKVPVQENSGAHHGGSLAFDSDGNLVLSTGDGTTPFPSDGYAPLDERSDPESYPKDAQRSASNTNDYKGKILRIKPGENGFYTIPKGNMFPADMPLTKPEIFAMGCRNPYRIAINPETGTIYWGEIGPDAGEDSPRGPKGYDEFNQAKKPGFYGWPYFVGNNRPYSNWDFDKETPGANFDPLHPYNESPNNTGLKNLPPPVPAMIYYPYSISPEFPELGIGGRSAMAGEFYTFKNENAKSKAFPKYYDKALFVFDWMRNWMLALRFDENENYLRNERFMPTTGDFRRPIDLAFDKNGVMFLLEYGSVYGADNVDARLVKIEYNSDNRAPQVSAFIVDTLAAARARENAHITSEGRVNSTQKYIAGPIPMTVQFGGRGIDKDFGDNLTYEWWIDGEKIEAGARFPSLKYNFIKAGNFEIILKVTDTSGLSDSDTIKVSAGNAPPEVEISSTQNRSFYWDDSDFKYEVKVIDKDGKKISKKAIKTTNNYNPQPFRPESDISGGAQILNTLSPGSLGKSLVESSDCKACHTIDQVSVGPSFTAIAQKYREDRRALNTLAAKIIEGGGGNWGTEHVMSAHPQLSQQDAREMVSYIFSLDDPNTKFKEISNSGVLELSAHKSYDTKGFYTLKAEATDKGSNWNNPQKGTDKIMLRYHVLRAMDADAHPGIKFDWGQLYESGYKSHLIYRHIDLTGVKSISFEIASKDQSGLIEMRKNSIGGPVIGKVAYEPTGAWDKMQWVEAKLEDPEADFQDLYFIAVKTTKPNDQIIKFKTVKFNK